MLERADGNLVAPDRHVAGRFDPVQRDRSTTTGRRDADGAARAVGEDRPARDIGSGRTGAAQQCTGDIEDKIGAGAERTGIDVTGGVNRKAAGRGIAVDPALGRQDSGGGGRGADAIDRTTRVDRHIAGIAAQIAGIAGCVVGSDADIVLRGDRDSAVGDNFAANLDIAG